MNAPVHDAASKLWIDDIRVPPGDDWVWVKTSAAALTFLTRHTVPEMEAISFDHDLGGDDTTRRVAYWMCEHEQFPKQVFVHSSNPVGVDYLIGMFQRYGNGAQYRRYQPPVSFGGR